MPSAVKLDGLAANLGAYCREFNDKIFSVPVIGMQGEFADTGVTLWDNIVDETPLVAAFTSSVVRSGINGDFTPVNDAIRFESRNLKNEKYKVDLKIVPDEYRQSWLSHNNRGRAIYTDWQDVPLHEYIMSQVRIRIDDDLRRATWRGIKIVNPVTVFDWIDGFVKRLKVGVAAATIPTVALGGITDANVIDKLETFTDAISDAVSEQSGYIHVPRRVYDMFCRADITGGRWVMFNDVPGKQGSSRESGIYLRNTDIKLVKNTALTFGATSEVFFTTKNNLFCGTDSTAKNSGVEFQVFDRYIKMLMDGAWCTQYAMDSQFTAETPLLCSEAFI